MKLSKIKELESTTFVHVSGSYKDQRPLTEHEIRAGLRNLQCRQDEEQTEEIQKLHRSLRQARQENVSQLEEIAKLRETLVVSVEQSDVDLLKACGEIERLKRELHQEQELVQDAATRIAKQNKEIITLKEHVRILTDTANELEMEEEIEATKGSSSILSVASLIDRSATEEEKEVWVDVRNLFDEINDTDSVEYLLAKINAGEHKMSAALKTMRKVKTEIILNTEEVQLVSVIEMAAHQLGGTLDIQEVKPTHAKEERECPESFKRLGEIIRHQNQTNPPIRMKTIDFATATLKGGDEPTVVQEYENITTTGTVQEIISAALDLEYHANGILGSIVRHYRKLMEFTVEMDKVDRTEFYALELNNKLSFIEEGCDQDDMNEILKEVIEYRIYEIEDLTQVGDFRYKGVLETLKSNLSTCA